MKGPRGICWGVAPWHHFPALSLCPPHSSLLGSLSPVFSALALTLHPSFSLISVLSFVPFYLPLWGALQRTLGISALPVPCGAKGAPWYPLTSSDGGLQGEPRGMWPISSLGITTTNPEGLQPGALNSNVAKLP